MLRKTQYFERARLQSCRKCRKINVEFSPEGMLFGLFASRGASFRNL